VYSKVAAAACGTSILAGVICGWLEAWNMALASLAVKGAASKNAGPTQKTMSPGVTLCRSRKRF